MYRKIFNIPNLTLLVALSLSTVAAFYSIMGLTAIFAGAVIPIIIMGTILEIGKITATVWLKKYWNESSKILKSYLIPAIIILALITSMGIFGFLSKSHSEVNLASNDTLVKLSVIEEKIKIQKENIENARKTLQQLDAQVENRMSRTQSEQAVERSVVIRKQQSIERTKLQKDIADAQQLIAKLNDEKAPLTAEIKKIEAEVGPIKYIAAFIYEDNPSAELLERAVRWVIILLVIVFDPLAIALVLAANASRDWENKKTIEKIILEEQSKEVPVTEPKLDTDNVVVSSPVNKKNRTKRKPKKAINIKKNKPIESIITDTPSNVVEIVAPSQSEIIQITEEKIETKEEPKSKKLTVDSDIKLSSTDTYREVDGNYIVYKNKMVSKDALKEMRPDLFNNDADNTVRPSSTNFGIQFPKFASKGDIFVRVDVLPNKIFKFEGIKWVEINKNTTTAYLHNDDYLQFLVSKIETGEYDVELLSDAEKEQIETYLNSRTK